jgi:hypothetical protein
MKILRTEKLIGNDLFKINEEKKALIIYGINYIDNDEKLNVNGLRN